MKIVFRESSFFKSKSEKELKRTMSTERLRLYVRKKCQTERSNN